MEFSIEPPEAATAAFLSRFGAGSLIGIIVDGSKTYSVNVTGPGNAVYDIARALCYLGYRPAALAWLSGHVRRRSGESLDSGPCWQNWQTVKVDLNSSLATEGRTNLEPWQAGDAVAATIRLTIK